MALYHHILKEVYLRTLCDHGTGLYGRVTLVLIPLHVETVELQYHFER